MHPCKRGRQQIASRKLGGVKLSWRRLPGSRAISPRPLSKKTAALSGALSFETWQMGSPHQWTHLLLETLEILHFGERPYYHPTARRPPTMDVDTNNDPGPGLKRVPSKPGLCRATPGAAIENKFQLNKGMGQIGGTRKLRLEQKQLWG